jgi:hypothetical protein
MVGTNKKKFLKLHNLPDDSMLSLEDISALSDIPTEALQSVFNRGVGAWKTNPQSVRRKDNFEKDATAPRASKLGKEQWAGARVYAFVMKTPKVYYGADNDIREAYGLE